MTRGTSSTWDQTSRYNTLRQRYFALLVPAIARVNRVYAHRTLAERAKAVREAATRCLLHASRLHYRTHRRSRRKLISSSSSSAYYSYSYNNDNNRRAYNYRSLPMMTSMGKNKPLKRWRWPPCTSRNKLLHRVSYTKALRWAIKADRKSGCDYKNFNHAMQPPATSTPSASMAAMIPDESDLQRLQRAILPGLRLAGGGNPAATPLNHHNQSATRTTSAIDHPVQDGAAAAAAATNYMNPADLLSQAAHYIIALQVQVDALQVLSQSIFNHDTPP